MQLSGIIKTSISALSSLENNINLPSADTLISLKRNFDISSDWLLYGEGEMPGEISMIAEPGPDHAYKRWPQEPADIRIIAHDQAEMEGLLSRERLDNYVPIRLLADRAAGGDPREVNENDIEGYTVIYASWVKPGAVYSSLRMRGDSMTPVLNPGDIVGVNHSRKDPAEIRGKIALVEIPNEGITVKYLNLMGDHLVLTPANPLAQTSYPRLSESRIIGAVEWAWRKFE